MSDAPPDGERQAPRDGAPLPTAEDARFAAFVGPRWESTYRAKFRPFLADPSFQPTWNWAAFFFGLFWFLYRKLYLPFLLFWLAPRLVLMLVLGEDAKALSAGGTLDERTALATAGVMLSASIAAGGTANWLLFRRALAAFRVVGETGLSPEQRLAALHRVGGVNRMATVVAIVLFVVIGLAAMGSQLGG